MGTSSRRTSATSGVADGDGPGRTHTGNQPKKSVIDRELVLLSEDTYHLTPVRAQGNPGSLWSWVSEGQRGGRRHKERQRAARGRGGRVAAGGTDGGRKGVSRGRGDGKGVGANGSGYGGRISGAPAQGGQHSDVQTGKRFFVQTGGGDLSLPSPGSDLRSPHDKSARALPPTVLGMDDDDWSDDESTGSSGPGMGDKSGDNLHGVGGAVQMGGGGRRRVMQQANPDRVVVPVDMMTANQEGGSWASDEEDEGGLRGHTYADSERYDSDSMSDSGRQV